MDPDATWAIITDVDSTPQERRDAALDLLVWFAKMPSGSAPSTWIGPCEAVIIAEFEHGDRLAGRAWVPPGPY